MILFRTTWRVQSLWIPNMVVVIRCSCSRYIDGSKSSDLIKTGRCLSFYQSIFVSVLFFHSTDWVYLSIHPSISLSIYPVISFIIYFNIDSLTTQGTWRHFCCHLKIKNINFPRRFWTLDCLDKFELPWCSIHRGIFNGINLH